MLEYVKFIFHTTYNFLCGKDAHLYPWHFQWLAKYNLHADLKNCMKRLHGRVLDIGCGNKPYSVFLNKDVEHVGLEIIYGSRVDYIYDGIHIPFIDEYFDCLLCTQVLEHVEQIHIFIQEIARCLKPGGLMILTFPFIYNQHGVPHDYRRYSQFGIQQLLQNKFNIESVMLEGGIGSTLGLLFLNWLNIQMSKNGLGKLFKVILLPFFLLFTLSINILGYILDKLDSTDSFYNNILIIAKRIR